MRFTIFTPSYNRAYTLMRLYKSLKKQLFTDFEWILVNDGSKDNTDELADYFKSDIDRKFQFTYKKTQNGGKHRAINLGVSLAQGELFFIVDSDDYLTSTALKEADIVEKSIPQFEKKFFGGICGLRGYSETKMMGKTYSGSDYLDITVLERKSNNISGEKAEIFYTSILRDYPFPEFDGETFLTECVVWDKMAYDGYKLRFFNSIIYICNYLEDGLTKNLRRYVKGSPKGQGLYLYQSLIFGKSNKHQAWTDFLIFYFEFKSEYSIFKISEFLHQNVIVFFIMVNLTRLKNCLKGRYKCALKCIHRRSNKWRTY